MFALTEWHGDLLGIKLDERRCREQLFLDVVLNLFFADMQCALFLLRV